MTNIFVILESSATQLYQDVTPTREFFFFFPYRHIYSPWSHGWGYGLWSQTIDEETETNIGEGIRGVSSKKIGEVRGR